jgi:tape measure domain-containing protein
MAADGHINIDTKIDGSGFQSGLKKLGDMASKTLGAMTKLIGGAATALGGAAVAGVKYNAQMEQYMTSFTTMLGSADKATSMVSNLKKFAADTPFEFSDLAKGSQTLLSFGVSADNLMPTLKVLGDVSQGNTEKFNSLSLAFGQVSSAGKMSGQDLLQFINAGFNPLNEISKKTGESMSDLRDRMSAGGISAQEVADAFQSATSKGGLFYNAMESQSKTFNGQLSTLKDNAMQFLGDLTNGLENSLKDTALPMVNGWMEQLQKAFSTGGVNGVVDAFGNVLAQAVQQIAQSAPKVISLATTLISSFAGGIQQNSGQLATAVVGIISALANGILSSVSQLGTVGLNLITGIIQGITPQLPQIAAQAVVIVEQLLQGILQALPSLLSAGMQIVVGLIQGLTQAMPQLLTAVVTILIQLIQVLYQNMPLVLQAGINLLMAIVQALPTIIQALVTALPGLITTLLNYLTTAIPLVLNGAIQLLMAIVNALPTIINALINALPQIINAVITGLITAIPKLLDGAIRFLMAIIQALPTIIQALVTNLPRIISTVVNALVNNVPALVSAAVTLFLGIIKAIPQIVVELIRNMPQIIKAILSGLKAGFDAVKDIGGNLIKGVWDGIKGTADWIWDRVKGFFGGLLDKIKGFLGIHSPSKLFAKEIGAFIPPGITIGMDNAMPSAITDVKSQIGNMMNQARTAISAEQARVSASFGASVQYQVALAGGYATTDDGSVETPKFVVENHISMNDREFAVAAGPAIAKQLGFEG